MGKITLEFDITEDADAIKDSINGFAYRMVIHDLDQALRSTVRREVSVMNDQPATELEIGIAEAYREKIRGLLNDYQLNIDL